MRRIILLLFFGVFGSITASVANGAETRLPFPSFSCSYAALSVEHIICQNAELRRLDWELDDSYRRAKLSGVDNSVLKESQAKWLTRRNECEDTSCIFEKYTQRVALLKKYADTLTRNTNYYYKPSYNCEKARPGVEQAICDDNNLSTYDWHISDVYQRARIYNFSDRFDLRREQNNWIRNRNACGTIECVISLYNERISHLNNKYPTQQSSYQPPSYQKPTNSIKLSNRESEIAEIIIINAAKCFGKKFVTDFFDTPEEKMIVGTMVSMVFDGEEPPSEKIAIGYAIDKIKQRLKESGHPDLANLISDAKMLHCLSNGLF